MSVTDYEVKFTALSRFAPKFVQNEEDKCTKFQDGLEVAIKSRVSVFEETNYNRLVQERRNNSKEIDLSHYNQEEVKEFQVREVKSNGMEGERGVFSVRKGRPPEERLSCVKSKRVLSLPSAEGVTSVGSVAGFGRGFAKGSSLRGGRVATSGSQAQGRVFAMTLQDAQATPKVVTGTLSILDRNVTVLIDPDSTHSFVASSIAMHLGKPLSSLDSKLFISTPMGEVVVVTNEYRDCVLQLGDKQLKVNLIPLGIPDFDVILGMN
ncbi:uncharacterized protein LOC132309639 [Cornus florida]|uniref:uncharacterized protein LOC132309639 n=1 Tax=Cornus florida TaxID=4283 RepID=UPI00289D448B|nr:uncharacterized protein LOC132309639 [Cornus florida]